MDTKLVWTFLEIVAQGSFNRAALRLNVAQTTVSARIHALEDSLGQVLFVRHKAGASLTPAGERFLRYAPNFVQLAQRMKRQIAVPKGHSASLTVGGEVSLWQSLVLDWVRLLRRESPELALHVHVDVPRDLVEQVGNGIVDIAVMYAPQHWPGIRVDHLTNEVLVLATTDPDVDPLADHWFVGTDWGVDFFRELASSFPGLDPPAVSFSLGDLATEYVLAMGGAGYFRRHAIEKHLKSGKLHLVEDAPQFSYPIHAVSSPSINPEVLGAVVSRLRKVAAM